MPPKPSERDVERAEKLHFLLVNEANGKIHTDKNGFVEVIAQALANTREEAAKIAEETKPDYERPVTAIEREISDSILMSWGKRIAQSIRRGRG